jgi:Tfp pilus assembly protein PilV
MSGAPPPHQSTAFSLVEVCISLVVISVMLTAALRTVAAARIGQAHDIDRARGAFLAETLMTEIVAQPYADPAAGGVALGPDSAEGLTGNRSLFNDVDDYAGWSDSPPQYKDGSAMTGYSGWSRQVAVVWVTAADFTQTAIVDSGVKRITVTVKHGTARVAQLVSLRSNWR